VRGERKGKGGEERRKEEGRAKHGWGKGKEGK